MYKNSIASETFNRFNQFLFSNLSLFEPISTETERDFDFETKTLTDIALFLHKSAIEHQIDFQSEDYRIYLTEKDIPEATYVELKPQAWLAHSPILINNESPNGFLISFAITEKKYCEKTLNKLKKEQIKKLIKEDKYTSESYNEIVEQLRFNLYKNRNSDNIPLNSKEVVVNIYYCAKNNAFVCQSNAQTQRILDRFNQYLHIILNLEKLHEVTGQSDKIEKMNKALISSDMPNAITYYAQSQIQKGETVGLYSLPQLVDYYCDHDCYDFSPTDTANFSCEKKSKTSSTIKFKDSFSFLSDPNTIDNHDNNDDDKKPSPFKALADFGVDNGFKLQSMDLIGELPITDALKNLFDQNMENIDLDKLDYSSGFIDTPLTTKSAKGNINFKLHKNKALTEVYRIFKEYVFNELYDQQFTKQGFEFFITEQFSLLFPLLDELFVSFSRFYKEANKVDETFGNDTLIK